MVLRRTGPTVTVRYRLLTDTDQQCWVNPGIYNTLEDLFAAFEIPLCTEYRVRTVEALRGGAGEVNFSLKDAFETV